MRRLCELGNQSPAPSGFRNCQMDQLPKAFDRVPKFAICFDLCSRVVSIPLTNRFLLYVVIYIRRLDSVIAVRWISGNIRLRVSLLTGSMKRGGGECSASCQLWAKEGRKSYLRHFRTKTGHKWLEMWKRDRRVKFRNRGTDCSSREEQRPA